MPMPWEMSILDGLLNAQFEGMLSIKGSGIYEDHLTVGQSTLNTSYPMYVNGEMRCTGTIITDVALKTNSGIYSKSPNIAELISGDISITSPDATDHVVCMKIDGLTIFCAQATGDGAGGIVEASKKAIVYGILENSRWESKEVFLNENVSNIANKPSLIDIGLFKAYSLPEYAAGEELLFSMRVPHDWDGSTNPWFVCPSILTAAEDVDDKYKFQLEWQSADVGGVFPVTTQETITHEVTVTDGTQYRAEILAFELDATTLVRGQNLQMRLRRIAASSSSVTGEIAIPHWDTRWPCSRIGTLSTQGY